MSVPTRFLVLGVTAFSVALLWGLPGEAGWLFRRHHPCDGHAEQDVVRLPAQEIRIETARPRVVVQETALASRLRHGRVAAPLLGAPVLFPMVGPQPIVATFYTPAAFTGTSLGFHESRHFEASSAFRALQDLEYQAMEVAKLNAAHRAELLHMERLQKRLSAAMAAPLAQESEPQPSEISDLRKEIEKLARRVDNIEKLVIIHDNLLKKQQGEGK